VVRPIDVHSHQAAILVDGDVKGELDFHEELSVALISDAALAIEVACPYI
jgi:hypothetical protein